MADNEDEDNYQVIMIDESEKTDSEKMEDQSKSEETESREMETELQSSEIDLQINEDTAVKIIID